MEEYNIIVKGKNSQILFTPYDCNCPEFSIHYIIMIVIVQNFLYITLLWL